MGESLSKRFNYCYKTDVIDRVYENCKSKANFFIQIFKNEKPEMKSKLTKQPKQAIKLPSIGNKTMGEMYKDTAKQRQRPLSSKNIVNDLEKKLFSQLQAYDEKALTGKIQKGSSKMKSKANSSVTANSCRQISSKTSATQPESMQKLAQLMPQLYSKIIQNKKYDDPKPLKQTFVFTNEETPIKQSLSSSIEMMKKKPQKAPISQVRNSTRIPSAKSTKPQKQAASKSKSPQEKQPIDSFDFAQKQIDSIYQQYLKEEGLDQQETSVSELKELNIDLGKCEVDIQELERNYSSLIKQLSSFCINQIE